MDELHLCINQHGLGWDVLLSVGFVCVGCPCTTPVSHPVAAARLCTDVVMGSRVRQEMCAEVADGGSRESYSCGNVCVNQSTAIFGGRTCSRSFNVGNTPPNAVSQLTVACVIDAPVICTWSRVLTQ